MNVWILHISHRHGDGYWAFGSEQLALNELVSWCREWWPVEFGEDEPIPATDDELIEQYFDKMQDNARSETYSIEEVPLIRA